MNWFSKKIGRPAADKKINDDDDNDDDGGLIGRLGFLGKQLLGGTPASAPVGPSVLSSSSSSSKTSTTNAPPVAAPASDGVATENDDDKDDEKAIDRTNSFVVETDSVLSKLESFHTIVNNIQLSNQKSQK